MNPEKGSISTYKSLSWKINLFLGPHGQILSNFSALFFVSILLFLDRSQPVKLKSENILVHVHRKPQ